jgi:uncharacterized protein (TIGR00255 family)
MTGYGDARRQNERLSVAVEVRSVNSRYLKIATKSPEALAPFENEIEKVVRAAITRGTVSVTIRADSVGVRNHYRIDREVLRDYWRQLNEAAEAIPLAAKVDLSSLLALPDVVTEEEAFRSDRTDDWPMIQNALESALESLHAFRVAEGSSMQRDLELNCHAITEQLESVANRASQVARDYRDRLLDRIRELLSGTDIQVGSSDLIREVSIFADRCDINEEITRLRSHLEQFDAFLKEEASQGRKLEFLSQEMFREINTIGSKANNVEIAHSVVEMKAAIEKMREILQNVE